MDVVDKIWKGGEEMRRFWKIAKEFVREEDAVGVVEIILILVGIFTPYYGMGTRCMA